MFVDVDLRQPTDVIFTCEVCGLARTLTVEGARLWIKQSGGQNPRHLADTGELLPTTRDGNRWTP